MTEITLCSFWIWLVQFHLKLNIMAIIMYDQLKANPNPVPFSLLFQSIPWTPLELALSEIQKKPFRNEM